jgi:hypothetical protein
MTREDFEQLKQRLDDQLEAGIALLRESHRSQLRALQLLRLASDDGPLPLESSQSPASPMAISPPAEKSTRELPPNPAEGAGLREWRVRKALEAYARGEGTLAQAAQQAGVPLHEMIPLAYAHGFTPKVETAETSHSGR